MGNLCRFRRASSPSSGEGADTEDEVVVLPGDAQAKDRDRAFRNEEEAKLDPKDFFVSRKDSQTIVRKPGWGGVGPLSFGSLSLLLACCYPPLSIPCSVFLPSLPSFVHSFALSFLA